MSAFWWGVIAVCAFVVVRKLRAKSKAVQAFAVSDEANPWYVENNIDPSSVVFSTYSDPALARNPDALILVGGGKGPDGKTIGFALEVIPGKGVVSSEIIEPFGIASYHKRASMQSKMSDMPLLDVLVFMAANHRAGA
ncbi:hypothetical protein ACK32Q_04925 [Aeromonas dhakensis]|uniref:hypothetical protein n=1 Tax=Aeromonas dhakensis TaxID=196024 RepID=UPI0039875669